MGKIYTCSKCGLKYAEEKWAKKCEAWCKEHPNSCSVEVVKHSIR